MPEVLQGGALRYMVEEISHPEGTSVLLSHGRALHLISDDPTFVEELLTVLRKGLPGESAYFFETPAASHGSVDNRAFEFVLIAAPSLETQPADPRRDSLHARQLSIPALNESKVLRPRMEARRESISLTHRFTL